MNCRIEVLKGDLQRFAPNLDFLASLIEVLAPEDITGHFTLTTCISGVRISFRGTGLLWRTNVESPVIPRWMFCEEPFRELLVAKAQTFLALVEGTTSESMRGEHAMPKEILPGWLQ